MIHKKFTATSSSTKSSGCFRRDMQGIIGMGNHGFPWIIPLACLLINALFSKGVLIHVRVYRRYMCGLLTSQDASAKSSTSEFCREILPARRDHATGHRPWRKDPWHSPRSHPTFIKNEKQKKRKEGKVSKMRKTHKKTGYIILVIHFLNHLGYHHLCKNPS